MVNVRSRKLGIFKLASGAVLISLFCSTVATALPVLWMQKKDPVAEAAQFLEQGHFGEARQLLNSLPDSEQSTYQVQHLKGLLALEERNYDEARAHFLKALEEHPGAFITAYNLALLYRAEGEYEKGIELVTPLLSSPELQAGEKAELNELMASLYELYGSPRQAAEHLYAALQLAPDEERYYFSLGSHLLSHLAFTEADKVIKAGCRRFPESARLFLALGTSAALQDNPDLAARGFLQAALLDPENPLPYRNLSLLPSFVLAHGETSEEISQVLSRLATDNPENAMLQYLVGVSQLRSAQIEGDPKGIEIASNRLQRALELDPDLAEAHHSLARLYLHQHKVEEALSSAKQAAELSPEISLYHYTVARVLMLLGRSKESSTWLAKFRRLQQREQEERRRQYQLLSVLKAEQ